MGPYMEATRPLNREELTKIKHDAMTTLLRNGDDIRAMIIMRLISQLERHMGVILTMTPIMNIEES